MPSFLSPLLGKATQHYTLRNSKTSQALADTLLTAFDSKSRNTGLLKHQSLPAGTALIIAPCSSIHTFFMKFPIDVIYVAKDGRVLKVARNLKAWRLSACWGAYAAIEMASGEAGRHRVDVNDVLTVA